MMTLNVRAPVLSVDAPVPAMCAAPLDYVTGWKGTQPWLRTLIDDLASASDTLLMRFTGEPMGRFNGRLILGNGSDLACPDIYEVAAVFEGLCAEIQPGVRHASKIGMTEYRAVIQSGAGFVAGDPQLTAHDIHCIQTIVRRRDEDVFGNVADVVILNVGRHGVDYRGQPLRQLFDSAGQVFDRKVIGEHKFGVVGHAPVLCHLSLEVLQIDPDGFIDGL